MLTRREFLKKASLGTLGAIALGSGGICLDEFMMRPAPKKEGKLIADIHTHPSRNAPQEQLTDMLSSGLVGLSSMMFYEDALKLPGVKEVDKGLLGKLEKNGNTGYFVKAQEVLSDHHILAVGCKKNIPTYRDSRHTIEDIHKNDGLAILCHPYMVQSGDRYVRYRFINEKEEKKVNELCGMVDEIEAFNAQTLNILPFVVWCHKNNHLSAKLAKKHGFVGTASTDSHHRLEQVKVSGIYLPKDNMCIDSLKTHIRMGDFERHERYVSYVSFFRGHFLSDYEHKWVL